MDTQVTMTRPGASADPGLPATEEVSTPLPEVTMNQVIMTVNSQANRLQQLVEAHNCLVNKITGDVEDIKKSLSEIRLGLNETRYKAVRAGKRAKGLLGTKGVLDSLVKDVGVLKGHLQAIDLSELHTSKRAVKAGPEKKTGVKKKKKG